MDNDILTPRAVSSLTVASIYAVAAVTITWILGKRYKLPIKEWMTVLWLVYDAIIHFMLVSALDINWRMDFCA